MDGLVALLVAVAVIVGVTVAVLGRDRYAARNRSGFSMPTHEVHVDPVTGSRQRVYVDPVSGGRSYIDEPVPIAGSAVPPLERPGLMLPPGYRAAPPGLPRGPSLPGQDT